MPREFRAALWAALLFFSGTQQFSHAHEHQVSLDVIDQNGKVLISIPMPDENSWCLLWNHSVAGFTVSDCFVNTQDALVLHSSHQPDFAAGLGYIKGRGNLVSDDHGGYLIEHINEPVPNNSLVLRVGSMAVNHRVLYKGQETSLSNVAAGQRIALRLAFD